jgi:hypothetical protein
MLKKISWANLELELNPNDCGMGKIIVLRHSVSRERES